MAVLEFFVSGLKVGRQRLSGPMSFDVPGGEIHILSGPNGCGKSLLLDAAVGVGPARGLSVSLDANLLVGSSPTSIWRKGIRRMFQAPILPGNVTANDVMLHAGLGGGADVDRHVGSWNLLKAADVDADRSMSQLSFGQRRAVELCMTLKAPMVALLDEPFSGIAPGIVSEASMLIRSAAAGGLAILVVDHLRKSGGLSYDQEHPWASPPEDLAWRRDSDEPPAALQHCARRWATAEGARWNIGAIRLESRTIMKSCSITVGPGQFVAIGGSNGTGKSTVLRALAGVHQPWRGVTTEVERDRWASRFFLSPQPPKLLANLRVRDNLKYMLLPTRGSAGDHLQAARAILAWMGLRAEEVWNRWAGDLSGGEAAMVALTGAALSENPVLLLDEPFEGLSQAAQPRALRLLACTLALGKSAVLTTHDSDLLARTGPEARLSLDEPELASGVLTGTRPDALTSYCGGKQ